MSKRSWNNGTRELEDIAGSVILKENKFSLFKKGQSTNVGAILGKEERDEEVGPRNGKAMGPVDPEEPTEVDGDIEEDAEGETLSDEFIRFASIVSALEQGMTEYDGEEISSDILRNKLNDLDAKLGTLGGEPEL